MYEALFGLQGRPFDSGIVHDVDVFLGRPQETLIGRFKLALASPDAVVTLSGPAGVGKTTLASTAVRATSTRLALAWLNNVPTNATELLELLLIELGMSAHRTTRIERLQMWRQYLSELNATDSRVFVIAERTEDLAPEVLRALDSLTAADAAGCAGANIVLLGRPGLDQFLAAPELDSLRQRIRLRQRLEPFSPAELADYLRHRIERAGGEFARVFAADAAAAVHRYSGGVARVANNLCETALGVAAADQRPQITAALIAEVAVDMLGLGEPSGAVGATPSPRPETTAPSAKPLESTATPAPAAVVPSNVTLSPPTVQPTATLAPPPVPLVAPMPPPARATVPPPPKSGAASASSPIAAPPAPAAAFAPLPPPAFTPPESAAKPVAKPAHVATPATVATPAVATKTAAATAPHAPAVTPTPQPASPPATAPVGRASAPAASPHDSQQPVTITAAESPDALFHDFEATETEFPPDEFEATAPDLPDVASIEVPVLTDEVEEPRPTLTAHAPAPPPMSPPPLAKAPPLIRPTPRPETPTAKPAAAAPPTRPAPAAATNAAPAQAPPRVVPPKVATPAPAPPAPAARAPTPPPAAFDEETDLARQTQTMRAISVAKSIDDISNSMAETLFGDADLDLLSAALASAGFEDPADAAAEPPDEPEAAESDDIMDLFNLGPDAPLELIDDSSNPPSHHPRKRATRS